MVRQRKRWAGFTIVELIVVIAVIGILVAIATITYSGYRQRGAKAAADSTIQQVKLKLSEHFTNTNKYPVDRTAVRDYLNTTGEATLATDFYTMTDTATTGYATYAPLAQDGSSCASGTPTCAKYTISVPKAYWNGDSADTDIVVNG